MMEKLESERIILRPITVEDTADILRWRNSPHVMEHFIIREPLTEEVHKRWLKEKVAGGETEQFIIVLKENGKGIGSQYYQHIDRNRLSAEFGIFIGEKDEIGKGYGPETLELAIKHARDDMGLKSIELRVIADNDAAYKLYSGRGFKVIPGSTEKKVYDGKETEILHMELKL